MFDVLAPCYDEIRRFIEFGEVKEVAQEIGEIKNEKGEQVKMLDVGGGTGNYWEPIFRREVETYVLDKNQYMLRESNAHINAIRGVSQILPFEDDTFDMVTCVDALHHFRDGQRSLKEMIRVVKPRGKVMIADFDPENLITTLIIIGERALGEPGAFMSLKGLKKFFRDKDYEVRVDRLKPYFYLFQATKPDNSTFQE